MNRNEKTVSAAQVLDAFKAALREGVRCGLIAPEEFKDTTENDIDFLNQNMR